MFDHRQLDLRYVRYVIAEEVAGTWARFWHTGVMLTNVALILERSITRNMEAACRNSNLQRTAWAQLGRERGNTEATNGDLLRMIQGEVPHCVRDKQEEFHYRTCPRASAPARRPL